jgi:S-adenosylmethionine hydrolase
MIGAELSSTFHGRDLFSPAAAHLARGEDWGQSGPSVPVTTLIRLNIASSTVDSAGFHGKVIGTDGPFGNLVHNIPAETFAGLGYVVRRQGFADLGREAAPISFRQDLQRRSGRRTSVLHRLAQPP